MLNHKLYRVCVCITVLVVKCLLCCEIIVLLYVVITVYVIAMYVFTEIKNVDS